MQSFYRARDASTYIAQQMYKSINIIKEKNQVIIAIGTEKAFWQNLILHDKSPEESGIEGTNLKIVRVVYDKSIADIVQLGWNIESISTEIKKKTSVPFSHSCSMYYLKSYLEQKHKRKKYKKTEKETTYSNLQIL